MARPRIKITLTVDNEVLKAAKTVAAQKGLVLSRLVETFLRYFTQPFVYCFACGRQFDVKTTQECPACGWLKCPECQACRCGLSEDVAIAVHHMRKVYEHLLTGRVK